MIRRRSLCLVLLAVAAVLAGCKSPEAQLPPDVPPARMPANALRIGVTPTYPPIIFRQGGQIVGVEADFASRLGARLGRPAYFVQVAWDRQIEALLARRTDVIMSGMSITEARTIRIAFTEPYLDAGLMAAVRAEDGRRYGSRDALLRTDATVGVIEQTTGDVFVQRNFPNARRVALTTAADGAAALRRRTIDIFVHDAPSIAWLVSANEADLAGIWQYLNREQLAWGVRRDDPELLARLNEILATWKQDGTLAGILARWLPRLAQAGRSAP
jgi:polar amino acid transport system substrate-binding protein